MKVGSGFHDGLASLPEHSRNKELRVGSRRRQSAEAHVVSPPACVTADTLVTSTPCLGSSFVLTLNKYTPSLFPTALHPNLNAAGKREMGKAREHDPQKKICKR